MFYICFGLVALVSRFYISKYRAEYMCALIFVMTVLYVFACAQNLLLGVWVIILLGGGFGSLVILFDSFSSRGRCVLLRQFFELATLFLMSFVVSWGSDYWAWDEFSHWGAQVDFLVSVNNLPTNADVLLFPDYIPGMSLLRYWAAFLLEGSGISSLYFVTWLLGLSCLYCVSYSESISKWCITSLIVFFSYIVFFQSLVLTLYVDPLQAIIFLCALKFAHDKDDESYRVLLLAVVSLILMKHVGVILAGFVGLYYVFCRIYVDGVAVKFLIKRSALFFGLVVFVYLSWAFYVHHYDLQMKVVDSSKLFKGEGLFENIFQGVEQVLNNRFPHAALIEPSYPLLSSVGGVSLWVFVSFIVALGLVVNFNSGVNRRDRALAFWLLIVTGSVYLLFLAYVVTVTPWGGDVYSFSRYFMVVLFATFLMQYFVARPYLSIWRSMFLAIVMAMIGFVVAPPLSSIFVLDKRPPVFVNEEYKIKVDLLEKYAKGNDVVWYVNDEKISLGYFLFRMKALPLRFISYSAGYYLYQDGNLGRPAEREARIKIFKRTLCKADYVYVDDMPSEFWGQYGSLFGRESGRIFKVVRKEYSYCGLVFIE